MSRASTYDEVAAHLAAKTPFTHPTCSGYVVEQGRPGGFPYGESDDEHAAQIVDLANAAAEEGRVYVLVSYSTPVAFMGGGNAVLTAGKYSATTSKHLGLFKDAFPYAVVAGE